MGNLKPKIFPPMLKIALIILLSVTMTVFAMNYYSPFPSNFDRRTASQKTAFFNQKIQQDHGKAGSWYNLIEMGPIALPEFAFGQELGSVSSNDKDEVLEGRKKLIHTVGKAAQIEWKMTTHNTGYTGCFASGVSCQGFVRLSSAKEPTNSANTPGISVKLFRDGQKSASFMAMWKLTGQSSKNFFENPLSHHVDDVPRGFTLNPDIIQLVALANKFSEYDNTPWMLGVSNVASYTPEGQKVGNVKSPFQIILQPNPAVKALCNNAHFESNGTYSCLSQIAVGTTLYRIYALAGPSTNPSTGDFKLLGEMVLKTNLRASKFMDRDVQFGHIFWQQEVKAMGAQGARWQSETRGGYKDHAGPGKAVGKLPNW